MESQGGAPCTIHSQSPGGSSASTPLVRSWRMQACPSRAAHNRRLFVHATEPTQTGEDHRCWNLELPLSASLLTHTNLSGNTSRDASRRSVGASASRTGKSRRSAFHERAYPRLIEVRRMAITEGAHFAKVSAAGSPARWPESRTRYADSVAELPPCSRVLAESCASAPWSRASQTWSGVSTGKHIRGLGPGASSSTCRVDCGATYRCHCSWCFTVAVKTVRIFETSPDSTR